MIRSGLLNRRAWLTRVAESGYGAVAMIDIDHFKRVNDTWGHPAGDIVLQQVAAQLADANGMALPARFGGEEFVVALDSGVDAEAWCEDVRAWIASAPVRAAGTRIPVSVSIGLADDTGVVDADIRAADAALYQAKAAGRNRVMTHRSVRAV